MTDLTEPLVHSVAAAGCDQGWQRQPEEPQGPAAVGGLAVRKTDPVTNGSGMSAPGKRELQGLP